METAVLFILLFGLLLIGAPIAIALGLSSILYIALFSHDTMSSVAVQMFNASQNFTLLAIPFFILASTFMSTGGVARRIVNFAVATVGSFRGGLAMAAVLACMIFAALSGSSPATVVAIGTIAIGAMRQAGYSKEFASGIIANAGTLGILIPPSIVMVVYAAATNVSVGRMFLAGVIPGIIAGLMLMGAIYFVAWKKDLPRQPFPSLRELWDTFSSAAFGMFLIVVIMGGIWGGVFTPTEAAAVAAVYAAFVALFIYRDMGPLAGQAWRQQGESLSVATLRNIWLLSSRFLPAFFHRDTRKVFTDSAKTTVMLMFIIVNALLFAHTLTAERIPQVITDWMLDAGFNWFTFLLAVNIILLIGGQFMEPSGLLLIVAPVVFPIGIELGVDPIHLGILMVVNMEIGMITPPIGLNLFVTSGITGMSLVQVVRAASPFVVVLLVFLVLVTYVPSISTFLPTMFMGAETVLE
ncbi:TRAP transporter large permease [Flexibacterium corallicola]|uniref:TRAP transporter large permease n=1 Tax=Flexibacterium corallicola TaxID=3037259 RepID=UPI00286F36C4|nr:TRAP transporter large permease subunit [Pseudovibrio sp. M1P-2-3]